MIELDPSSSSAAPAAALAREDDRLGDLVKVGVVGDEVLEGRGLQSRVLQSIRAMFRYIVIGTLAQFYYTLYFESGTP